MKYCSHCGKELLDEAVICPGCGCATGLMNFEKEQTVNNSGLKIAIKIFMIIGVVFMSLFYLIPLAWGIPMIIHYFNKVKRNEPVGTAFKICTLLFVSGIAGIIMLCDKE